MSRRGRAKIKKIAPDLVYNQVLVAKLINRIMKDGKKQIAAKKVYRAFDLVKEKTKKEPLEVFERALDNIRPKLEVRSRRVGGAAYQVPQLVRGRRAEFLALRWLVNFARKRANKEYHTFEEKLAAEIIDAYNRAGGAMSKRGEVEKIAEANRVFAHLRW
ncbi:30S ribosomal protein S7 [Candidatus Shapirobacteria bacterium]|nr:30S ribosomal protein S7 [Candidatus Shapirobacteria bacterium]